VEKNEGKVDDTQRLRETAQRAQGSRTKEGRDRQKTETRKRKKTKSKKR
jgi:hypothetical protein